MIRHILKNTDSKVDVHNPELWITVEIRDTNTFIYFNSYNYYMNERYNGTSAMLAYQGELNSSGLRYFSVNNLAVFSKIGMFSFNIAGGRCEACAGDGVKRLKMYFMSDVFVPCEVCGGKRYSREVLDVKYKGKSIGMKTVSELFKILKISSTLIKVAVDTIIFIINVEKIIITNPIVIITFLNLY